MRVQLVFDKENPESKSLTQQQFKKESDINNIVNKYKKTGILPGPLNQVQPFFGDFSEVPEFQTLQNTVNSVNLIFSKLPAETRKKFNNSPAEALDFLSIPENNEEAYKLGLIKQPTPKPPQNEESPQMLSQQAAQKVADNAQKQIQMELPNKTNDR